MLFDYYTGVKMEPSNLWVDMMYSTVEFKMTVLEELLRVLSPKRKIFVTAASLDSKILQLILFILFRRVNLSFMKIGQWSRRGVEFSISLPQRQIGLRQSWKLCLNPCSWRWLKPKHNLVNSLIPLGLWQ